MNDRAVDFSDSDALPIGMLKMDSKHYLLHSKEASLGWPSNYATENGHTNFKWNLRHRILRLCLITTKGQGGARPSYLGCWINLLLIWLHSVKHQIIWWTTRTWVQDSNCWKPGHATRSDHDQWEMRDWLPSAWCSLGFDMPPSSAHNHEMKEAFDEYLDRTTREAPCNGKLISSSWLELSRLDEDDW